MEGGGGGRSLPMEKSGTVYWRGHLETHLEIEKVERVKVINKKKREGGAWGGMGGAVFWGKGD